MTYYNKTRPALAIGDTVRTPYHGAQTVAEIVKLEGQWCVRFEYDATGPDADTLRRLLGTARTTGHARVCDCVRIAGSTGQPRLI